jgi:acetyltransferase-like isoleucine patch superfamily enzyme
MEHLPNKHLYLVQTLLKNPSEIIRLARVAWSTFRFRFLHRCVGPGTVVGEGTVMTNASNIHIGKGNGAALNSFVQIYGHGGIEIGDDTQVGPNTVLTTTGHDYLAANLQQNYESIKIGRRVWISANCTILPGVTIGDQAVIGAGAVVSRNIPARCVALGIPARVVRHFNDESDAMEHDSAVPHARAENQ